MNLTKLHYLFIFLVPFLSCGQSTTKDKIITNEEPNLSFDEDIFIDVRDGAEYTYANVGKTKWMTIDLRYKDEDSYCYKNNEAECLQNGRLYTYQSAMKSCPDGWRVPTKVDWAQLESALGMQEASLDSFRVWRGTNEGKHFRDHLLTSFGGKGQPRGRSFEGKGVFSWFWEDQKGPNSKHFSMYRMIMKKDNRIYYDQSPNANLLAVRCVQ